jgi:nicotinamidase-related amidase
MRGTTRSGIVHKVTYIVLSCRSFSSTRPGTVLAGQPPADAALAACAAAAPLLFQAAPDACVQGSWGAALHTGLILHETDVLVTHGHDPTTLQREEEAWCG